MNKNLIFGIILLIVAFIAGFFFGKLGNSSEKPTKTTSNDFTDFKQIRLNEDFTKEGTVENLENVHWNHVSIMQFDNELEVSLTLDNMSETEKIEARELTVHLLDKKGNVIISKDVQMPEIAENYGYAMLDFECEIEELMIIEDIQIKAK